MTNFLQQNWIWILFIGAMLVMHLGGHRHGGHGGSDGHGQQGPMTHAGCGGGHAGHGSRSDRGPAEGDAPHRPTTAPQQAESSRDATRPD